VRACQPAREGAAGLKRMLFREGCVTNNPCSCLVLRPPLGRSKESSNYRKLPLATAAGQARQDEVSLLRQVLPM
jgi:hypothetical protein